MDLPLIISGIAFLVGWKLRDVLRAKMKNRMFSPVHIGKDEADFIVQALEYMYENDPSVGGDLDSCHFVGDIQEKLLKAYPEIPWPESMTIQPDPRR